MISKNAEGHYTWQPDEEAAVVDAIVALHERLADAGCTDQQIADATNNMLAKMRLRQLN